MNRARVLIERADRPLVAAILLGCLGVAELVVRADGDPSVGILLGLGATLPLALGRTQPVVAATVVTVATLATLVTDRRLTAAALLAQVASLYLLGRYGPRRAPAVLLLPFAGYAVVTAGRAPGATVRVFAVVLAFFAAGAVWLGRAASARRAATETATSRQLIADNRLELAARSERARIARELHDVVAHHISVVAVQAETARLTTPDLPAEGARRLVAIGDTARNALTEMRRLLGVLRDDAATAATRAAARAPQPSLAQLTELLDEARAVSGASTRLIVRGPAAPLDPGVELAAYRIVQEALTNVRRHAPGAAVDVELRYTGGALHVCVRDNGPGPRGAPGTGHGLLGMGERAAMVGGDLHAGPHPGSGFVVRATLPTGAAEGVA